MELILGEELLLLALDDARGSVRITSVDLHLGGALLVDLGRLGALRLVGDELHSVKGIGIEHPVLARAAALIASSSKPQTAKAWVLRLPRELGPLTGMVARPLVRRGILTERQRKVLGLPLNTHFPEADPGPERMLRSRLRDVLLGGQAPREQDALLLGLLEPLGLVDHLVERHQRREVHKRAKEIATSTIAGRAASDVVRSIYVTLTIATITSMVIEGGGF